MLILFKYSRKWTPLNNAEVRKNISIVLVTIFDKFQNLQKAFILECSKVIIKGSIL